MVQKRPEGETPMGIYFGGNDHEEITERENVDDHVTSDITKRFIVI